MDFDVRRQDGPVQFIGLGFHALEDVLRLLPAKHENDALNRIVVLLITEFAQPRRMADHDLANVLDSDRYAIVAADHDVPDIAGVAHQSNAAHVIKLATLGVEPTACIGVIRGQCRHRLAERSGDIRRSAQDRAAPDIA